MGASDYLEDLIRKQLMRTGTWTKDTTRYVSLHTGDPGDTGVSEVTGGSYARVQRDASDANWSAGTATDGLTSNVGAITFPSPTANWGTATHFGIWDAVSGGNFLASGALTIAKTINNGDAAPSFGAGALVVQVI